MSTNVRLMLQYVCNDSYWQVVLHLIKVGDVLEGEGLAAEVGGGVGVQHTSVTWRRVTAHGDVFPTA